MSGRRYVAHDATHRRLEGTGIRFVETEVLACLKHRHTIQPVPDNSAANKEHLDGQDIHETSPCADERDPECKLHAGRELRSSGERRR